MRGRLKLSLQTGVRAYLVLFLLLPPAQAEALCATPGRDGSPGSITGIVNTYYPATASAAAGAASITLGASRGAATPIASGDLLLVIQMQDTNIDSTNTSSYGSGVPGNPSGYTSLRSTGLYEYVVATNAVATGGGTLNLTGTGAGSGLLNAYANGNPNNTTHGQRRFQVVRVPQYGSTTLTSGLTAATWDGSTGGVLAVDVSGNAQSGWRRRQPGWHRVPRRRRPAAGWRHGRGQHGLRAGLGEELRRRQG